MACHALSALLVLGAPAAANGQQADPKTDFLDALGAFALALDGTRGDEGDRLGSALDRMNRALTEWDAMIVAFEAGVASEIQGASPPLASRMRTTLGIVYLDRLRVDDALEQFAMARQLDAANADAPMLQGLAYGQLLNDDDRAVDALRVAATARAKALVAPYYLARYLRKRGREDEAVTVLQSFLSALGTGAPAGEPEAGAAQFIRLGLVPETAGIEPFLPPLRYADGFIALRQGDLRRALERWRAALSVDPLAVPARSTEASGLRHRAAASFRDGLVQDARDALETLIVQAPEDAEAHRLLGLVEVADGRYDQGIARLRRAVDLNPGDERSRLGLADAHVQGQDDEAAVRVLSETLQVMPDSGRAHYALGLIHQRRGSYAEALVEFERTISLGPLIGLNSIWETVGRLRRAQQDLEGAIEAFAARAESTPAEAKAHQDLGTIHSLLGNNEWARTEFRVALLLEPSSSVAYTALGQVYLREARYQEAADASLRALTLEAGDREARYVYATALIRLGRADEGTHELQTFQRLQAEDDAVRARGLELGRLRRDAAVRSADGDHAGAATLLREALVYDPRAPSSHLDLGLALLKAGQFAEAAERLSTAAALGAPRQVHLHLAEAYAALGRADDSRREQEIYATLKREAIRQAGASQ